MDSEIATCQPRAGAHLQQLYQDLVPTLRATVYTECADLLVPDVDAILALLAERLHRFDGPQNEFEQWARRYVMSIARHRARFYALQGNHAREVFGGIWGVLRSASDLADETTIIDTARRLARDTWAWAWWNTNSLIDVDSAAKPGTRLFAKAKWLARGWRQTQIRERDKLSRRIDMPKTPESLIVCNLFTEQPPRNTTVLCLSCRVGSAVLSETPNQMLHLACGHSRHRDANRALNKAA